MNPTSASLSPSHPEPARNRSWGRPRGFFRFHGIWAPGVRLLRRWSFRDKLLLVLALMGLPLLVMTWTLLAREHRVVQALEQRQAGADVAIAAYALGMQLNAEWQALVAGRMPPPAPPPTLRDELGRAVDAALQVGVPIRADWEAHAPALDRAVQRKATARSTRVDELGQGLLAIVGLHDAAVRGSDLLLSSDRALKARAWLAFEALPTLQADVGRLRAHAHRRAELTAAGAPAPGALAASTVAVAGLVESVDRMMRRIEGELASASVATLPVPGTLPAVRAVAERSRQGLVRAGEQPWDAASIADAADAARTEVVTLRHALAGEIRTQLQSEREAAERVRAALAAVLIVTLLGAVYAFYSLYLVMQGGLDVLMKQMQRLAQGDLTARLKPHGHDEIARTMGAMTASLVGLSDLLASVRESVSAFGQASGQVAAGNADLSMRNRSAAQGLEQLVAGVAAYSAQLEACGRQVDAVVGTVQALRLEAARNRKQMARLAERLQGLQRKSREIGEIVTLIDGIAFRTNILALNASVEASKAGESGRGFAVVAQEVRALALRSADSARRIGDIVTRSTEDIETSGVLAEATGRSLGAADEHVDRIHAAMNDVSALTRSGEEQSAAILAEITRLKDSTTSNLRIVEQLALASKALRVQGERLAHKVGQFKLS
jgi:methyl-accepting chemotaxis protein